MKKTNIIRFIAITTILLGGCSTVPGVQEFAATANSAEEVPRFAADMKVAVERQVDALSPSAFSDAQDALQSASADEKKSRSSKDILHKVAVGRAHLSRANRIADISRANMEDVVAARQAAIIAGAAQTVPDQFSRADENLRALTSRIEENDLSEVSASRPVLQAEFLDVELQAIKLSNLGFARATIAQAKKEGADDYAKRSLAIAEKKSVDTEAFITANRHNTIAVKLRSEDTVNAANHLLKITRASKAGTKVSPEETALRMENEQEKSKDGQEQLAAERKTAKHLAVETRGLKSERDFNQSFETARSEFTRQEAEIYRQGNRLVIRLRDLEFPVNQSALRGANFPLLAKVAKVVKGFENANVVIEGHTDSDGKKEANNKLSAERAKAVLDYLVSNEAVEGANIRSVGYGFDRPLSSNRTAKGKAQNRRVDVIISPDADAG